MSETSRKDLAKPKSQADGLLQDILQYCGGGGGGGCAVTMDSTQFVYPIRVPKFVVFNRSLLLRNLEFVGINIYSDAGSNGFCDHTLGTLQPWWLGFSDDGVLTDTEVKAQDIMIDTLSPQDILVMHNKLPQPVLMGGGVNPDWENRIYVHIVWDSPGLVREFALVEGILQVVKYDYDEKI
jgi:hypothetical protein